jgi:hypothetical protein
MYLLYDTWTKRYFHLNPKQNYLVLTKRIATRFKIRKEALKYKNRTTEIVIKE